jgi:Intracellular proteinase inhibitor
MRRAPATLLLLLLLEGGALAQDITSSPVPTPTPTPVPTLTLTPTEKRGWMSHVLHPFGGGSSKSPPKYKNPKLRGLLLSLQALPQPVKLSEVRHLEVKLTVTNQGKAPITLDFPSEQRIEIYLRDTSEMVLTKFSDNHAFAEKPATVMINMQEHVEYDETIATRDLTPDKVFILEVFFPKYQELVVRQKFMTAP